MCVSISVCILIYNICVYCVYICMCRSVCVCMYVYCSELWSVRSVNPCGSVAFERKHVENGSQFAWALSSLFIRYNAVVLHALHRPSPPMTCVIQFIRRSWDLLRSQHIYQWLHYTIMLVSYNLTMPGVTIEELTRVAADRDSWRQLTAWKWLEMNNPPDTLQIYDMMIIYPQYWLCIKQSYSSYLSNSYNSSSAILPGIFKI